MLYFLFPNPVPLFLVSLPSPPPLLTCQYLNYTVKSSLALLIKGSSVGQSMGSGLKRRFWVLPGKGKKITAPKYCVSVNGRKNSVLMALNSEPPFALFLDDSRAERSVLSFRVSPAPSPQKIVSTRKGQAILWTQESCQFTLVSLMAQPHSQTEKELVSKQNSHVKPLTGF